MLKQSVHPVLLVYVQTALYLGKKKSTCSNLSFKTIFYIAIDGSKYLCFLADRYMESQTENRHFKKRELNKIITSPTHFYLKRCLWSTFLKH